MSYTDTKAKRINSAMKRMLYEPELPRRISRIEKAWRKISPPKEGWFFAGDFITPWRKTSILKPACLSNQTSILRKDLEELNLIEYHPEANDKGIIAWNDTLKNRTTHRYVFRLRRDVKGALKVLKYICSDRDLYQHFYSTKTPYGESIKEPVLISLEKNRGYAGSVHPEFIDPRFVEEAVINQMLQSKSGLDLTSFKNWDIRRNWVRNEIKSEQDRKNQKEMDAIRQKSKIETFKVLLKHSEGNLKYVENLTTEWAFLYEPGFFKEYKKWVKGEHPYR